MSSAPAVAPTTSSATPASTKAADRALRRRVLNALAKAKGYTRSLGCTRIEALAVADPGMLNAGQRPDFGPTTMRAMAVSAPAQDTERSAIELTPAKLRITADVEARFEAS